MPKRQRFLHVSGKSPTRIFYKIINRMREMNIPEDKIEKFSDDVVRAREEIESMEFDPITLYKLHVNQKNELFKRAIIKLARELDINIKNTKGPINGNWDKLTKHPKPPKTSKKSPSHRARLFVIKEVIDTDDENLVEIIITEGTNESLANPESIPLIWYSQPPYYSLVVVDDMYMPILSVRNRKSGKALEVVTDHEIPQDSIDWIKTAIGELLWRNI